MATSETHTLKVKVSYPERVGGYVKTPIELSFRLPQWAVTELNMMDGVAVCAAKQNHILLVVTPSWVDYRARVLNLIVAANTNALAVKTVGGLPGYNVLVEEQVLATQTSLLTPESPLLSATEPVLSN
jgi:hypothetical protein